VPAWVLASAAGALALGTALGGWSIVRTLGRRIVRIRSLDGLVSQGSSAAVVALVAAFARAQEKLGERPLSLRQIVLLSHGIESNTAGVPCGLQDQLAAAYGGVNAWYCPLIFKLMKKKAPLVREIP
jgi:hypothetical protein